jgi:hypothetical protein
LGTAARAVSFWAKSSSNSQMSAVSWGDNGQATRYNCMFNYMTDGPTIDGAYGAITYSAPSAVNDNNWHHYVYQFSSSLLSAIEVYQDGVLLTTTSTVYNSGNILNTSATYSVTFGRIYCCGDLFYNGSLDDIGIWNRTLTSCEIQQLFRSTYITSSSTKTISCTGEPVSLVISGATNFTWTPAITTTSAVTINPVSNSSYTVIASNTLTGCSQTILLTQKVSNCVGLAEDKFEHMNVFPNPSTGYYTIMGLESCDGIQLTGQEGKLLKFEIKGSMLDISDLDAGVYFLQKRKEGISQSVKLVKE